MNDHLDERIRERLATIMDPELGASLGELGMLGDVRIEAGRIEITIALTTLACPARERFRAQIREVVAELAPALAVDVREQQLDAAARARVMSQARLAAQRQAEVPLALVGTRILAIASGKGGVGKSTISHLLARTLAERGHRVGLLDADVWGFSQPHLTHTRERLEAQGTPEAWQIKPVEVPVPGSGALALVSMGLLVEDADDAIMWRGPLLARAFEHFVADVAWNSPDYLVIDLPPGTGDVPLALARRLPDARVLIVTTPSPLAQTVARRAGTLARKAHLDILGVIENMSWLACPHGERVAPFGTGGGAELAEALGVPLLAQLPLGDVENEGANLVAAIEARLAARASSCTARLWNLAQQAGRLGSG